MSTARMQNASRILPRALALAAGAAASAVSWAAEPEAIGVNAAMMRFPDISASHICFVYANDIWLVSRDGGTAFPLASPPGPEALPKFSADGKSIAFVGNYDGNRDLYTVPIGGGIPTRVTYHPAAEALCDWAPSGDLLYITNGFAGLARQTQAFTIPAAGGMPSKLPVPYAGFGAISPDGTWLAYTPHSTDNRTWKRYRGGMATDIWLFNLKDKTSKKVTDWEGTDTIPMWVPGGDGSKLYYLSDNGPEHRLNIWSYDVASGAREQLTAFKENDIRWPSIGPGKGGRGEIVFQFGTELRTFDIPSRRTATVSVKIPGARPSIRPRTVDASNFIASGAISPSGKRVAIEARGDIWSAPAKEGAVRNLTRTDGTAERDPAWSPDGRWIAYFSDQPGEYELWVRPSDAKPPEPKDDDKKGGDKKDDKQDEKKEDKKGEVAKADADKPAEKTADGKPAEKPAGPRQLTRLGAGFRYNPTWSPDSKHITFTDQAGSLYLVTVESGEAKLLDKDPWSNQLNPSWSSDSGWLAYSRADDDSTQGCIWLYNIKSGEKHQVTSPMFNNRAPVFDRKGDFLYFASQRTINSPIYDDLGQSFVYTGTDTLLMVPLRKDVKSPWLTVSDEERLKADDKDAKKDDAKAKKDEKKDDKKNGEQAAGDDAVSGTWEGAGTGGPEGANIPFTLNIKLAPDGAVSGSIVSAMGSGSIAGTYDKATGQLTFTLALEGAAVTMTGTVKGEEISGTWTAGEQNGTWTAKRTAKGAPGGNGDDKNGDAAKDKKDAKELKIDLEGFEARAVPLPIGPGAFGALAVSEDNKLIYVRGASRGSNEPPSIKIFDPKDDTKEEKTVTAGAGGFQISADGKKLLVFRGRAMSVMDASAGGGKSTNVVTAGMRVTINPRAEWKQIFTDAWRLQRDFFYEPTMHGLDWPAIREQYGRMIDDCVSREDVSFVIGEMISELNIGHAYVTGNGDGESQPSVNVGLLGCDFTLDASGGQPAYKIARIYRGAPWDTDAIGPLSQPGVDVAEGDYLLAVDGVPVDTTRDPWAAFIGLADRPVTITVSKKPVMGAEARDVLVKPVGSEGGLRYRDWIEHNRKYVDEKSGGKIGYIYVPNTGVDGQSDLFRQFYGQASRAALIIDDRWNGGGQIPNRFIELLNRPATNYWARRDGRDWKWPPDSHQGPKAMLINGLAGSGGDMFPWLFRHHQIGKLIGARTWGGLVGISGNPQFIDGGAITVPTFGFYKLDGTWGVEGHGVDPDLPVVDDPAQMVEGGDPQLDAAINHLLEELKTKAYTPPQRPASPNRTGMGIPEKDR
ncbi:MAG: PD40 domain-containing protein [Phycisphaerales bacterium]|nr:PD40 domain-containing protein [Phycisphaerales bacterium]